MISVVVIVGTEVFLRDACIDHTILFARSVVCFSISVVGVYIMQSDYLTAEEVAKHFRVSPETIRRLCKDGKIPGARQIGRQWRIPAKFLEDNPSLDTSGDDDSEEQKD
ncbi:MAG: helix-turn-helix domain-containing protein [Ktedonobacteraceae bacterium]